MRKDSIIYIVGAETLIGFALVNQLRYQGYTNVFVTSPADLDLTNSVEVESFFFKKLLNTCF